MDEYESWKLVILMSAKVIAIYHEQEEWQWTCKVFDANHHNYNQKSSFQVQNQQETQEHFSH